MTIKTKLVERVVPEKRTVAECDTCGAEALQPPDSWSSYPEGWVVVLVAMNEPAMPRPDKSFCSWRCANQYVKNQVDQG